VGRSQGLNPTSWQRVISKIPLLFRALNEEYPSYFTLSETGFKEIRDYKPFLLAQIEIENSIFEEALNQAHKQVGAYFSSQNSGERSLVDNNNSKTLFPQKIPLMYPIFYSKNELVWRIAYVIPSKYSLQTVPLPLDSRIKILETPERIVAVIKFSGQLTSEKISQKVRDLKKWIQYHDSFFPVSGPVIAQYASTSSISFLRRYEIHIEIKKRPLPLPH